MYNVKPLLVAFSGGRTSAYMSWLIRKKKVCAEYDPVFVYANTGFEHEDTLRFVNEVDWYFGLNLIWLEAVVNPEQGIGIRHKQVDYRTCSRKGEPYRDVLNKYVTPTITTPICTSRMKTDVITSFMRECFGTPKIDRALGIRADETRRAKERENIVYPLVELGVDKDEVLDFMGQFDWDLRIPEHLGNCVPCFKKSDRKLVQAYNDAPEYFHLFESIINTKDPSATPYRKHRRVIDIINLVKTIGDTSQLPSVDGGCSESCEFLEML